MSRYLLLIFISINIFSQEDKRSIYVDNKENYCFLVEKGTTTATKIIETTVMDIFVNAKDDVFNYSIVISKIDNHNFINGNLLDLDYEKYIKENCNCEVIDSEIVLYNNLKSLRYKIKTQNGKNYFIGYIDSFVCNSILYNILFLTSENNFNSMSPKYIDSMNTLIINGKTTIDNYKKDD